jgi:ATP-dependent Clp protease ATP-binding subunit ClpA
MSGLQELDLFLSRYPLLKEVLAHAERFALSFGHDFLGTWHVLFVVLSQYGSSPEVVALLGGKDREELVAMFKAHLGKRGPHTALKPCDPMVLAWVCSTIADASRTGSTDVKLVHLILHFLAHPDEFPYNTLVYLGLKPEECMSRVLAAHNRADLPAGGQYYVDLHHFLLPRVREQQRKAWRMVNGKLVPPKLS